MAAGKRSASVSMSRLMHAVLSNTLPRKGTGNELSARQRLSTSGGMFEKRGSGRGEEAAEASHSTGGKSRAQHMVAMSRSGSKAASDASKPRKNSADAATSCDDPGFDETRCEPRVSLPPLFFPVQSSGGRAAARGLSTLNRRRPPWYRPYLGTSWVGTNPTDARHTEKTPNFFLSGWNPPTYPHAARRLRRIAIFHCVPSPLAAACPFAESRSSSKSTEREISGEVAPASVHFSWAGILCPCIPSKRLYHTICLVN